SARRDSLNKKLAQAAAQTIQQQGGHATLVDLADFEIPMYHGDLEAEQGIPTDVQRLQDLLAQHQGLLIASPEYNGMPTPLLLNTLDWLSRGSQGLSNFTGKPAALLSASPGGLGGLRSLWGARQFLGNLGLLVLANQLAVGGAMTAFDEQGLLSNPKQQDSLNQISQQLIQLVNATQHPA
ncbi:MAG: NAD(P)H-dependent oxidoreductase, partial [Pseudomonadota bacterium]|nr:NAD(P)H-dependent oxidoreductase [Pseudomonadota bacterium]